MGDARLRRDPAMRDGLDAPPRDHAQRGVEQRAPALLALRESRDGCRLH